jgi:hypothetical protein
MKYDAREGSRDKLSPRLELIYLKHILMTND